MSYRRITVLGASGFVGRSIVKRLAAQGAVIAAVGRHASTAGFLRPMGDVGQIAPIDADVTSDTTLAACIAGADVVVNTIGVLYERGTQRFDALHHRLPARIAKLAKAAGVKQVLHVSAIGADAQSPALYGRSKAAGEAALRAEFPSAIVLRPSLVFGPDDSFFNRFGALAMMLPALPLFGGGATRFQPVYVGDVAAAAIAAVDRRAVGQVFELAGPRIYSFRELMELLLREIGRRRPLVNIPYGLAEFEAMFLQLLPKPPLTRDQVRLLERDDNLPAPGTPGLVDLGITPTALELILPTYVDRFRRGGGAWRPRPA
jgi:NADH dehydrogenase